MRISSRRAVVAEHAQARSSLKTIPLTGLCLAASLVMAGAPAGAAEAWFTAEQAERGQKTFFTVCAGCHGADQISDSMVKYRDGATWFNFMSGSMPSDGDPLPTRSYVDILAYIMSERGFPAGEAELTSDRALLSQIDTSGPAAGDGAAVQGLAEDGVMLAQADAGEAMAAAAAGSDAPALYRADQATRGQSDFTTACGGCHGSDMVPIFASYGDGRKFFDFVSVSMPADRPGELSPQQYARIIAYLMREAGFPTGDEQLRPDPAVLGQIVLDAPPPPALE